MTPCGAECLTAFLGPSLAAWPDFLGRDVEERTDGGQAAPWGRGAEHTAARSH